MNPRQKRRSETFRSQGTISQILDCGSIVLVLLRTADGWQTPVAFDHRSFRHLLDGECCTANDLIGRRAESDGLTMKLLD